MSEPELISAFRDLLAGTRAYIADGHHRYATALRYRDETGPEGAWTFGYFTPMEAPGLLVLPYHRILAEGPSLAEARSRLAAHFDLPATRWASAPPLPPSPLPGVPMPSPSPRRAGGRSWRSRGGDAEALVARDAPPSLRALDTYFLHQAVLGRLLDVPDAAVRYVHSLAEAEEAVAKATAAGSPSSCARRRSQQIVDVAEAGESMPAKSTFFHPKLPSGLVIHPLVV